MREKGDGGGDQLVQKIQASHHTNYGNSGE